MAIALRTVTGTAQAVTDYDTVSQASKAYALPANTAAGNGVLVMVSCGDNTLGMLTTTSVTTTGEGGATFHRDGVIESLAHGGSIAFYSLYATAGGWTNVTVTTNAAHTSLLVEILELTGVFPAASGGGLLIDDNASGGAAIDSVSSNASTYLSGSLTPARSANLWAASAVGTTNVQPPAYTSSGHATALNAQITGVNTFSGVMAADPTLGTAGFAASGHLYLRTTTGFADFTYSSLEAAKNVTDVVTVSGSATITSVSNPWTSADVHRPIVNPPNYAAGTYYIAVFNNAGSVGITTSRVGTTANALANASGTVTWNFPAARFNGTAYQGVTNKPGATGAGDGNSGYGITDAPWGTVGDNNATTGNVFAAQTYKISTNSAAQQFQYRPVTPPANYQTLLIGYASSATSGAPPTVTAIAPAGDGIGGGSTVIFTGTNFLGATSVKFGATNATSFTILSATQISAVVPAHAAGTVDCTVTTPDGTNSNTAGDNFTFYDVAADSTYMQGVTSTATGNVSSLPAGTFSLPDHRPLVGDTLLLIVEASQTVTTPTGYTLDAQVSHNSNVAVFRRTVQTGDLIGNPLLTFASPCAPVVHFCEIGGVITAVDDFDSVTTISSTTTLTPPTVDSLAAVGLVVMAVSPELTSTCTLSGWTNSFTERADSQPTSGTGPYGLGVATRAVASPASYSTAATASATMSSYVAVAVAYGFGTPAAPSSPQRVGLYNPMS